MKRRPFVFLLLLCCRGSSGRAEVKEGSSSLRASFSVDSTSGTTLPGENVSMNCEQASRFQSCRFALKARHKLSKIPFEHWPIRSFKENLECTGKVENYLDQDWRSTAYNLAPLDFAHLIMKLCTQQRLSLSHTDEKRECFVNIRYTCIHEPPAESSGYQVHISKQRQTLFPGSSLLFQLAVQAGRCLWRAKGSLQEAGWTLSASRKLT